MKDQYTKQMASALSSLKSADGILSFSGGCGGVVSFDGKGCPLVKKNAPIDRIIYTSLNGEVFNEIALSVFSGSMDHLTGSSGEPICGDDCSEFYFEGMENKESLTVRGAIPALGLSPDTLIYSSSLGIAYTRIYNKNKQGLVHIPHWGTNLDIWIHSSILDFFKVSLVDNSAGSHKWDKTGDDDKAVDGFVVAQGVASLDIYVKNQ